MNDVFKNRRSIRSYTEEPVSRAQLEEIVEAAGYAPSGMNAQSWQFTVFTGGALERLRVVVRDYFRTLVLTDEHPPFFAKCIEWAADDDWSFFYHAPALLVISNRSDYRNAMPDSAAAAENALLKATAMGLGSCWITTLTGTCDDPQIRASLNRSGIPDTHRVFVSVALGHAAQFPQASARTYQTLWCAE